MSKFEVMATVWSFEQRAPVKIVIGEFDKYINARIFAEAYSAHYSATTEIYSATTEIIEYKRV